MVQLTQTCNVLCNVIFMVQKLVIVLFLLRIKTPRNEGGLGEIQIPLLSDITKQISKDYGVLLESDGHALR